MKQLAKNLIIGIIGATSLTVLLLFSLGVIDFTPDTNDNDGSSIEIGIENITLIVDYVNGSKKVKNDFFLEVGKTTVLDALLKWCQVGHTEYPGGDVFITELDGVKETHPYSWLYYVNDDFVSIGAAKYELKDNDVIEWIYTDTSV